MPDARSPRRRRNHAGKSEYFVIGIPITQREDPHPFSQSSSAGERFFPMPKPEGVRMWQIFVILLAFASMAMAAKKKSSKRRNRKLDVIPVEGTLALSTLADDTVVVSGLTSSNLTEDFFVISTDLSVMVNGLTAGEGEPMTVGISHGDYSAGEIGEATDVELLGPADKIQQEQADRLVRKITTLRGDGLNTQVEMKGLNRDGGPIIRTKWRFVIENGKTPAIWIKNRSGAALTTGATLRWDGYIYGRWLH